MMSERIYSILVLSVLPCLMLQAQEHMLSVDHDRAGVNDHCYEFFDEEVSKAPAGFKLVYLSHYGRHGARTDKGDFHYDKVIDILDKADSMGILTRQGAVLRDEVKQVLDAHTGMEGHLTRVGQLEQRELARRVHSHYRDVFHGKRNVRVECSTVPRCLVSMACFVSELASMEPMLKYDIVTGEKYFAYINNDCSKEQRSRVKHMVDSLKASVTIDTVSIYSRLFSDPSVGKHLAPDADKFQLDIFYAARVARSSGVTTDVFRHLPDDVIYKWWDCFNRDMYMRQCNSVEFGDDRMRRCQPLVDDIFTKAERALADGAVSADLKFGHDYPVLALACYLRLEGIGERYTFDEIPQNWNDPTHVTFASNLQIAFYRNRKGETLVKFAYNGRERHVIGMESYNGFFYRWDDIRRDILHR